VRRGALVDVGDARTIGRRLYQIRKSRGKSLRVVAGLAGMSTTQLWRIEHGERALDSLSEIVALADALQIAPSELMRLPVPAPANGETDSAINAVFLALMAARRSRAGGQVLPVEALRTRVVATVDAHCHCDRGGEVGAVLPSLIRDLHTSIAAGRDVAELLDLAVLLHSNATVGWLRVVAPAAIELREMAAELAFRAAEQRETPEARGLAVWGGLYVMVTAGAVDLARAELDSASVPTRTPEGRRWTPGPVTWTRPWSTPRSWRRVPEKSTPTGWDSVRRMSGSGGCARCWRSGTMSRRSVLRRACSQRLSYSGRGRLTTGSPTACRWPGCGGTMRTRRRRCAVPK
jgi:transcriptional regulator with XRE-family HTH domain